MTPALGKMTITESGEILKFSMNPSEFRMNRHFDFQADPCLGEPAPLVSFRCGGATRVSFQLNFDQDADPGCDVAKVQQWLRALNKINGQTRSVSPVQFAMGDFTFSGFVQHFDFQALRFDNQGKATSARLGLELISNGEYEHGNH